MPGALLGPEGSAGWSVTLGRCLRGGVSSVAVWSSSVGCRVCVGARGVLRRVGVRVRPYFENCTVDASIFIFVVKLLRAHGGCLGTRSR